jgi:fluoride ion exporter CrcB/FEX
MTGSYGARTTFSTFPIDVALLLQNGLPWAMATIAAQLFGSSLMTFGRIATVAWARS